MRPVRGGRGSHRGGRAGRDGRGAERPPGGGARLVPAGLRTEQAPPDVAERGGRDVLLRRRAGPAPWPPARLGVVRRTGGLGPAGRRLDEPAPRAPDGAGPPVRDLHDAAAAAADPRPARPRRPGRGGDPHDDVREPSEPRAGVRAGHRGAVRRHAPRAPGTIRRGAGGRARGAVDPGPRGADACAGCP